MRTLVATMLAALTVALSGCTAPSAEPPRDDPTTLPDVASKEARAIKAEAGIADCPPPQGNGPLPAVTLACLGGGRSVDMSTLEGPILINFFQATCPPCRDELPLLQEFSERHPEITVIGIEILETYAGAPEASLLLAADSGVTYPLLADPEGLLADSQELGAIRLMPTSVFIAADGTISPLHHTFFSLEEIEEFVGIDP